MNTKLHDVVVLTEDRYAYPKEVPDYVQNIIVEDGLLVNALAKEGLRVARFSWSDPNVDWSSVKSVVFRSTWDYFDRYQEFKPWFDDVKDKLIMFNDSRIQEWNQDKIYLKEMEDRGVRIPETIFIEKGSKQLLSDLVKGVSTEEFVLKPNVSGAARHTYRMNKSDCGSFEEKYQTLIAKEDFMIQAFQNQIMTKGEISLVLIDGEFTHAVLKQGKEGDFRVQDDFGGTVTPYLTNEEERYFAKKCYEVLDVKPQYCRVDIIWDNEDKLALSELEMIEPELWFRFCPDAALKLAKAIKKNLIS